VVVHYQDDWLTVHLGDCRTVMAGMEPESVHTVVTSPPYWGLRDYGTASWEGGDEGCDHVETVGPPLNKSTLTSAGIGATPDGAASKAHAKQFRDLCRKCGAQRQDGQIGLEPTPEAYVESMVAVFREVKRVLRSDGTVWLNLGDSYSSSTKGDNRTDAQERPRDADGFHSGSGKRWHTGTWRVDTGLKPKDLVGIPWRVAFALQADGWYLRSDIIWAKPNPMPESVTDRPTKSHEYLFLLSKSPRYFFDAEAVREPMAEASEARYGYAFGGDKAVRMTAEEANGAGSRTHPIGTRVAAAGRNLRSVWTIATQPYPGAHFATFPQALVEPCIKAGSPQGGIVLDPFAGSGTTGLVAQRLSRRAVLIDLNGDYLTQVMERNRDMPLGLGA
jgi:DNA modification methylase